jgi:uncharacterized protein (TIGR03435 family)
MTIGTPAESLIKFAYSLQSDSQILGGPKWIRSDRFDVEAKIEDSAVEKIQKLPWTERSGPIKLMLQSLLADRFDLKVSHETKELLVHALVLPKNGSKLGQANDQSSKALGGTVPGWRKLTFVDIPVSFLAASLARLPELGGRVVLDQTQLKGTYSFTLQWAEDRPITQLDKTQSNNPAVSDAHPPDSTGPSIFTAIKEQLGLKLEPRKGPVDVLVIDHIEKPTEN